MLVKLSTEHIRVIATFERLTKVHARDCLIMENAVYFLVEAGKVGLAIGKEGVNVKHVSKILGRPVKVFAYADTPEGMVKSIVPGVKSVERSGDTLILTVPAQERSLVIGKGGSTITMVKEVLKRHFSITEVRLR